MSTLSTYRLEIGYKNKTVAQCADMVIPAYQITALLGSNGAGKSTFFKTVMNLIPPLSGQIEVGGEVVARLSPRKLASIVGYVPQVQKTIPNFTVNDFVLMGRASQIGLFSEPDQVDQEVTDHYLALMNITHLKTRYLQELSGGERQLVLIARSLVLEPKLLLMDEPTANLDFGNQVLVLECILALKERGYAVIFSTHQPLQVQQIADKLLIIEDKKLQVYEDPKTYLNPENLSRLYRIEVGKIKKYMKL